MRMYTSDNDDMLPTNRITAAGALSVSCQLATITYTGNPANPEVITKNSVANYVEGLQLYLEKLEDARGNESIWRCPTASDAVYPPGATPSSKTATVTYVMSYYMAEQTEGRIDDASNTLLMREVDRKVNALLRPYPKTTTSPLNSSTNPAYNPFPTTDQTGTFAFINPVNVPIRHSNGFIVLFVDGHVAYRTAPQVAAPPGGTYTAYGVTYDTNTSRWYAGASPTDPFRVWISL